MTDYFALLDQPRAPWLDPEGLKEIFHRKTLQQHPDSARGEEAAFAELNEAYQVLQDPKRRLLYLLSLKNSVPAKNQAVPQDLEELFLEIGRVNQGATQLLGKLRAASNALSKSLLKAELVAVQKKIAELREKVRQLNDAAEEQLRQTDVGQTDKIASLYQRFAYLGRWTAQLEELAFELVL